MSKRANFRVEMPVVATFIDELRVAFGAEEINQTIKDGVSGVPTFWARENGHEIGTRLGPLGVEIDGDQMVITRPKERV